MDNLQDSQSIREQVKDLIRPQLVDILEQGKNMQRFTGDDIPKGVVIDNVRDHTLRCIALVDSLDISEDMKIKLRLLKAIHDIPEIAALRHLGRTADVTAPEKMANPRLAKQVANLEMKFAKKIFTADEMALYLEAEESSKYFKTGRGTFTEIGLLAKVIDTVEACTMLHTSIVQWALTDNYNPALLKENMSIVFPFNNLVNLAIYVNRLENWDIAVAGRTFTLDSLKRISRMWEPVIKAGKAIPEEIEYYV